MKNKKELIGLKYIKLGDSYHEEGDRLADSCMLHSRWEVHTIVLTDQPGVWQENSLTEKLCEIKKIKETQRLNIWPDKRFQSLVVNTTPKEKKSVFELLMKDVFKFSEFFFIRRVNSKCINL